MNVATSLDLSDHISERSRVEKAAASTITRKPDEGWKSVSVSMLFAVTCKERHSEKCCLPLISQKGLRVAVFVLLTLEGGVCICLLLPATGLGLVGIYARFCKSAISIAHKSALLNATCKCFHSDRCCARLA